MWGRGILIGLVLFCANVLGGGLFLFYFHLPGEGGEKWWEGMRTKETDLFTRG